MRSTLAQQSVAQLTYLLSLKDWQQTDVNGRPVMSVSESVSGRCWPPSRQQAINGLFDAEYHSFRRLPSRQRSGPGAVHRRTRQNIRGNCPKNEKLMNVYIVSVLTGRHGQRGEMFRTW